jgi:translation initiation factor IF-3
MYERTKKEREAKKGQKSIEIKELRIRPKTNWYHTGFKLKRVREFLADGNKIRVRVIFRAREITHTTTGRDILEKGLAICRSKGKMGKQADYLYLLSRAFAGLRDLVKEFGG